MCVRVCVWMDNLLLNDMNYDLDIWHDPILVKFEGQGQGHKSHIARSQVENIHFSAVDAR